MFAIFGGRKCFYLFDSHSKEKEENEAVVSKWCTSFTESWIFNLFKDYVKAIYYANTDCTLYFLL